VARPCLIHGDPGAHNLLWDGTITGILDWEWAGFGNPLADLAWVCWTIRFRALPDATRQAFLAAYGMPDPDLATLHAFSVAQIAMILSRVAAIPEARQEWIRRLEATLAAV
jgi:aminoglycoside phosphotransferase (APT) family kinase protein